MLVIVSRNSSDVMGCVCGVGGNEGGGGREGGGRGGLE
jgi:hypothetical protein